MQFRQKIIQLVIIDIYLFTWDLYHKTFYARISKSNASSVFVRVNIKVLTITKTPAQYITEFIMAVKSYYDTGPWNSQ